MSADASSGMTIIGFIGSVFSPYYAWARRRGAADPRQHCAVNVALYGARKAWAMTERGAAQLATSPNELSIGRSTMRWDADVLTVHVDERSMPFGQRLRGTVRVHPPAFTGCCFNLDPAGLHRWSPMSPSAEVEVDFASPGLKWRGQGYLDSNDGDAPLEDSFASWQWSRAGSQAGARIFYDVTRLDGSAGSLALHVGRAGEVTTLDPSPSVALPRTRWGIGRATHADGGPVHLEKTLEDTPFYARSVIRGQALGVHESLSLARFRLPVVQAMLPFRMPRRRK